MLEILTFTGVDAKTDLDRLVEIAEKYPRVEFGILVGSQSSEDDHGIFPPLRLVRLFRRISEWPEIKAAIHLCGRWSREVMSAYGPPGATYALCKGFGRVQINLHGDYFNPRDVDVRSRAVERFADNLADGDRDVRVILQHRAPWSKVPVEHPRVEYLFDRSAGAGRAAFDEWPEPESAETRYGYAGGIGPDTIGEAMAFVNRWPAVSMWLDMEGRVRTGGWFDLDKVETVCAQAFARPEIADG